MEAVVQDRDPQQRRMLRRRARIAGAILLAAVASVALGSVRRHYQFRTFDFWQARLIRGEPVVARFICGADPALDCNVSVKFNHQRQDANGCEKRSDPGETDSKLKAI